MRVIKRPHTSRADSYDSCKPVLYTKSNAGDIKTSLHSTYHGRQWLSFESATALVNE